MFYREIKSRNFPTELIPVDVRNRLRDAYRIETQGGEITAGNLSAGGTPGGDPLKTLSFTDDIRCRTIRETALAVELDPLSATVWAQLAACKLRVGLFDEAEKDLRRVLEIQPGRPFSLWLFGPRFSR